MILILITPTLSGDSGNLAIAIAIGIVEKLLSFHH